MINLNKALTLAIFLIPSLCLAEPPGRFADAVRAALLTSPQVEQAEYELKGAEEQIRQARSAWLPQAAAEMSQSHEDVRDKGGVGRKTDPTQASVSLTQTLYNREASAVIDQANPYVASFRFELENTRQGLILSVAERYLGLLKAMEVAQLAATNVTLMASHLEATRARYEVGELTRTDVSQAEARLASAQAERIRADNDVAVYRAQFHEVVGQPPAQELKAPVFPEKLWQGELDALLKEVELRPDVRAMQLRLRRAEMEIGRQRAGHWPTASLSSSASRSWNQETSGYRDPVDRFSVTVGVSVPLFEGFAVSSKVDEAHAKRDAQRAELDGLRRQAAREVEKSWLDLQSARSALKAFQAAETAARDAYEGVKKESQVGTRTALDVLDAQKELFDASTDLAKSRYDILLAEAALGRALGRLVPELLEDTSK